MARKLNKKPRTPTFRQLVAMAQRRDVPKESPDLPVEHIAERCGVSRGYLYKLMNGETDPKDMREWTLHRLSRGLGQSVDAIIAALQTVPDDRDLMN